MNEFDTKPEFRSKENLSIQSLRCKDAFFGVKSRFFGFFCSNINDDAGCYFRTNAVIQQNKVVLLQFLSFTR